ncbi:hypothetical protein G4B88_027861 [Cannabis sativa]|uniref:Pentatricopeptide repeat-containing protein n=1 Tax=Cannabis sativa TaxID=3483 RepID=A0A7J6I8V2_CANSA|nr:hypothetical protein G4B88_027861 [Cannabis sativa]
MAKVFRHSHPQNLFNLLESCNSIRKLKQIHNQLLVNGFTQKNFLIIKLLFYYVYSGYLELALTVFENVGKPSTALWNQIIRGHGRSKTPRKLVELYNRMVETEVKPDGYTYSFLLNACVKSRMFREGEQVHGRVFANGYCSNILVQTNLVNFYAVGEGANRVENSRRVVTILIEKGEFSMKCRREMLSHGRPWWLGCAQNGKSREALSMFQWMRRSHMGLDQVALVSALSACVVLGDLELGRWIHWYIRKASCVKN